MSLDDPSQDILRAVSNYMRRHIEDCVDPQTDEVNHTQLAEKAALQFDLYLNDECDIPGWVFDLAIEVDEE